MTLPSRPFFFPFWVVALVLANSCSNSEPPQSVPHQEPPSISSEILSEHTSGTISKKSSIHVVFAKSLAGKSPRHETLSPNPFTLSPHVEGKTSWHHGNKLVFEPAQPLKPGQQYEATVDPSLIDNLEAPAIVFSFTVRKQSFELDLGTLEQSSSENPSLQRLAGTISTADFAQSKAVEAMVQIEYPGKNHRIEWNHSPGGQRHHFNILDIKRLRNTTNLKLILDGTPIGAAKTESLTVSVTGLNIFSITNVDVIEVPEQVIQITFSDSLNAKQDMSGLIRVGTHPLRFHSQGNRVTLYSRKPWANSETVTISNGIRNSRNKPLFTAEGKNEASYPVIFVRQSPAIRFASKGNIIPTGKEITLPLEVLNVGAVSVEVLRVHSDNIPQFLQVNAFGQNHEMARVGRPIWKGKLAFEIPPKSDNQWFRVGLDLSELSQNQENGLYHVKVNFGPQDILYHCANFPTTQASAQTINEGDTIENSYWDNAQNNNWYENYRSRKNPCHQGFYKTFDDHSIAISRNIIVSDIGIIAKKGASNQLKVIVTDLSTANPLSGASIRLFDYQQELIVQSSADQQGIADFSVPRKPFLVEVNHNGQQAFLRLVDGSSLSVSHFDAGGAQISEGLKGYLYGERGVWRPGDTLYLTFILMDEQQLPQNHPVQFELRNSRGQLVEREVQTSSTNGFYTFSPKTHPEAPTGRYVAKATIGNTVFTQEIKVETVVPNRLKIGLDFPSDIIKGRNPRVDATLSSAWLHGATASGLRADVHVSLSPLKTAFKKYGDYQFDDLSRQVVLEGKSIFDASLDNKGNAIVQHDLTIPTKPAGMLSAQFETRVFEPSGAFSSNHHSIKVSPYERYIGLKTPKGDKARGMLLTDTKHTVDIVALTTEGEQASDTQVDIALYQIKWRWWWETGQERLADYAGSSSFTPVQKGTVQTTNGRGQWQFEVKYPSWGRYVIVATDKSGGHSAGKIVYVDWPGWAGRAQKDNPNGAHILSISTDKKEYKVGETVSLTIPSSIQGRALVSLESGSSVLNTTWVKTTQGRTHYEFDVTPNMAPNIYAHVMLLQPHKQTQNDLPIRLYGVAPIPVINPNTKLLPVLESKDNFEPERDATIEVSESSGRAMTYTVALVDEGLLGLTGFQTPNPWFHFYRRESLGVKTWDLYDWVAGAYSGKLEQLLAIGGGADTASAKPQKNADRFPPFVRFMGPFTLASGETNTHTLRIPQYLGAGRIMVVAANNTAFGSTSKTVTIKRPLMVLATLPRLLGPQEEVDLPINIFALEDHLKEVSVNVKTSGPLKVIGDPNNTLRFESVGDQLTTFRLSAENQTGIARVDVTAISGDQVSRQTIEIAIRHPLVPVTHTLTHVLEPDEKVNTDIQLHGLPGTNQAFIEISGALPLNLGPRLDALVSYPHGCAEQTVSKAFPQVFLSRLVTLSAEKDQKIRDHVQTAVDKLQRFQTNEGSFSYWEGQNRANDWTTSYAGHFLLEAQNAGFPVSDEILSKWAGYQNRVAQGWTPNVNTTRINRTELMQAYRLYTLALAGNPSLASMNRLKEHGNLNKLAQWRLAAAYQLAGQSRVARELVKGLSKNVEPYRELSNTFGSSLRDKAMILETLVLLKSRNAAAVVAREVSTTLSNNDWLSTQETAFSLVALVQFGLAETRGPIELNYTLQGKPEVRISDHHTVITRSIENPTSEKSNLELHNPGETTLFVNIQVKGVPALGKEKASQNNLQMEVSYLDTSNQPINIETIKQGTDFVAKITLTNTSREHLKEMALSHLFPSGWELHNERLNEVKKEQGNFDYQDIRDDRVLTYFSLSPHQTKVFEVRLNASYAGRFYLPAVNAEAMYDARTHSRTRGRWVEVYRPGLSH